MPSKSLQNVNLCQESFETLLNLIFEPFDSYRRSHINTFKYLRMGTAAYASTYIYMLLFNQVRV